MIATLDTNVLIYALDRGEPAKQEAASEILAALGACTERRIGLQVLGECYHAQVRRLKQTPQAARAFVEDLSIVFRPFGYDRDDVLTALGMAAEGVSSYWDGLLLCAAERAGCTHLVSEDMHDGFRFGGLEIVRPFDGRGDLNPKLANLLAA